MHGTSEQKWTTGPTGEFAAPGGPGHDLVRRTTALSTGTASTAPPQRLRHRLSHCSSKRRSQISALIPNADTPGKAALTDAVAQLRFGLPPTARKAARPARSG